MSIKYATVVVGAGKTLRIIEIPIPSVVSDDIIIENKAVAFIPADLFLTKLDMPIHKIFKLKYSFIFGVNCAGIVIRVGSGSQLLLKATE